MSQIKLFSESSNHFKRNYEKKIC